MSYPPQGAAGVTKLSELVINADKDWQGYGISNLKEIVAGMAHGDVPFRGASILEKLVPTAPDAGKFLQTQGPNRDLVWGDAATPKRFIWIPTLTIPAPAISLVVAEDHSGGGHTATPPALSIPVPTVGKAAATTSVNAVGGAVAHDDDGVDTDETTEANSAAANDMTLLQADGATADWYALGYASLHDGVVINVGTAGADITLDTFEYSKGADVWGTLTPIVNQLNNWETTGKVWFTFERPGDWATDTVGGIANMYWIRIKASATGGGYSQPLGTQAWILVYA